jgi:hypothetical protein
VIEGLGVATLPRQHHGELEVGVALPDAVADLSVQVEGPPVVGVGIVGAAQPEVGPAEEQVGARLRGRVDQTAAGGQPCPS